MEMETWLAITAVIGAILVLASVWLRYVHTTDAKPDSELEKMATDTTLNWIALMGAILLVLSLIAKYLYS